MAVLALLLALVSVAASGYLFWQGRQDDAGARVEALEVALAAEVRDAATVNAALDATLAELRAELARLQEVQGEQQQSLTSIRSTLAEAAVRQIDATPADGRQWKLAEVEFLMRGANHRLLMERDARGAQRLLASADGILVELDDFAFHDVRALLAAEVAALRDFQGVDVAGVFLRIEALKGSLDRLPLRLPEYTANAPANEAPQPAEDASLLELLAHRFGDLLRFRRHDGTGLRPLLPPEQAAYLEQRLRLALDRAQLALLRRDQAIFQSSLTAAREWLSRFVDAERGATAEVAVELDALLALELEVDLPDISTSLARLRALRRTAPPGAE